MGVTYNMLSEAINAYKILTGNPGKILLGRPNHRWEVNIKVDVKALCY
jgi:hypothetical protein